jgi:leucyl/phenylalanyl-tRNA--protein transferase
MMPPSVADGSLCGHQRLFYSACTAPVSPSPHLPPLSWLTPGDPFPAIEQTWGADSPLPGLLAAGDTLDPASLLRAYRQGIFPWYSPGDPVLWWCPDPRMVLYSANFRLHRSLRKTVLHFRAQPDCEIRIDSAFSQVIRNCALSPRAGQHGTWIVPDIIAAYEALHLAGWAHSVETWMAGELVGGLYLVNLGRAVFGESMFSLRSDASKIALAALVAFARQHGIALIDCQQNTRHLASLGAHEISRSSFLQHIQQAQSMAEPRWQFQPLYWDAVLSGEQPPRSP